MQKLMDEKKKHTMTQQLRLNNSGPSMYSQSIKQKVWLLEHEYSKLQYIQAVLALKRMRDSSMQENGQAHKALH